MQTAVPPCHTASIRQSSCLARRNSITPSNLNRTVPRLLEALHKYNITVPSGALQEELYELFMENVHIEPPPADQEIYGSKLPMDVNQFHQIQNFQSHVIFMNIYMLKLSIL